MDLINDKSLEPWMRGYLDAKEPVLNAVLYSLQQSREDIEKCLAALTDAQVWESRGNLAPVGFHILHIAGSVDRLTTYAAGDSLTEDQLQVLGHEKDRELSREELRDMTETSIQKAEALIRSTDPNRFGDRREIGRKRIPTTLIGLLFHIAEHTQRHVGEAIITAKLVR
ncbi:MAG: DinB family protein [Bryobacteraceae bacterium]|nr:DinB family protein [Bryobacteraceae bacterium]